MTDETVFAAALAIPHPADRAAYLEKACAGNPALRREVEALLSAHAADNPLDRPHADLAVTGDHDATDAGPPAAEVGDRIGRYRLMEQIGEGGFGLVFVAEQAEPVRRKVALKVLKPGMDTRDVVARFEAERQALALMDHPNIARVLDAGSTPAGRPYFVMELVRGVPITDYCDAHKLAPKDRLDLLVQVCQAVQHAHQKGVIHRDIKPSNVLVTIIDGKPVPKVIDFGVAKAVGQSLTEKTIYTRFAQILGTPLYMSPEQAEMSGVDVDTRADVYALGVLLYELLTGTTPFDRDRFRRAAFDEIRRIIREEEPPRPSTRLSSLGPTLADVSAQRGTEPGKLTGLVRGELDWIVMKCLEKDRNCRYETASDLGRDLQRFLEGDAVEACPPTLGYRLRKFYRRNRAAAWIAAGFVLLTYFGASGIYFAYQRAIRAEIRAAAGRDAAELSRRRAESAGREAAAERDNVEKANASLRELASSQQRTLYDRSMNLAQAAWESGDAAKTLEMLLPWVPKPGEDDLRGFEWHYWNRQAHQEQKTAWLSGLPANSRELHRVFLSPDGSRIVAMVEEPGGASQTLRLWDAESGREFWRVPAPMFSFWATYQFSADSGRVMGFSNDGTLTVWETATGRLISSSSIPVDPKRDSWHWSSADGSLVAIWSREKSGQNPAEDIRVVRVSDQKEVARLLTGSHGRVGHVAFSPDSRRLAVWENPRSPSSVPAREADMARVRILELDGAREVWSANFPDAAWMVEGGFSPDGRRLLVRCLGDSKERLTVLDSGDGHVLRMISVPEPAYQASALRLSGHRLAIAKRKHAYVFDLDHPDGPFQVCQGHEYDLLNLAFRPDGFGLVSVDVAGVVKEWNLAGRTPGLKTPFYSGLGSSVLLTPDATRVIFVPTNETFGDTKGNLPSAGFLRVTDGKGKTPVEIGPQLPGGHLHLLSISADSRNLASLWDSGRDYTFLVVDMVEGREKLRKILWPGSWVTGGAFAPDASRAVLLTDRVDTSTNPALNRELRVYDTATGRELRVWKDPKAGTSFRGGCYSPDGRWLVIERFRGDDHRIVWLDAKTLAERVSIRVEKPLAKAVFSRDGRQVAISQTMSRLGGLIDVWTVEPLLRRDSQGPSFRVSGLAGNLGNFEVSCEFSPDGRRLLTTSQDTVKLWDTSTGGEVLTLKLSGTRAAQSHFSPDGQKIWAGLDEKNRFWGWDATPLDEAKVP